MTLSWLRGPLLLAFGFCFFAAFGMILVRGDETKRDELITTDETKKKKKKTKKKKKKKNKKKKNNNNNNVNNKERNGRNMKKTEGK